MTEDSATSPAEGDGSWVSLFSGGKDSSWALYRALEAGLNVTRLLTVHPGDDSYMYHVPATHLAALAAESIGIELVEVTPDDLGAAEATDSGDQGDAELEPLEAALEDLLIQIRNAENSRGLKINLMGQALIVPPALEFEANRILKSTLRSGTAENDINAMRAMGMLPEGIICNPYLTDEDAFFIRTNAPNGLKWIDRMAPALTRDNDFDTSNAKMKTTGRWVSGWSDWRGAFASPGA